MICDCEYNNIKLPSKIYQKVEEKVSMLYVELNINKMPIDPFDIANRRVGIDLHINKWRCGTSAFAGVPLPFLIKY